MTQKERWSPKKILIFLCLSACIAAAVLLFLDARPGSIAQGVRIADVDVGGMSPRAARAALEETARRMEQEDMVLQFPEEEIRLSPADMGVKLNVRKAVSAACDAPAGVQVGLTSCLTYDEAAIREAIGEYVQRSSSVYTEPSYVLEGKLPELSEEGFDPSAPVQTLAVTLGTPGITPDGEALYQQVLHAYGKGQLRILCEAPLPDTLPSDPDLNVIAQAVSIPAVNASLDMETYQYIPGSYGCGFDLAAAQRLVSGAAYGETVRIPMELTEPELLGEAVYYRDVLGEYHSGFSGRTNIQTNLQLVCDFLNGVVIQPGETFSYNDCIGERTLERGFLYGESFTGTQESRSPGGGVCQGSSMLYVCTLLADLEVVERVCHGIQVSYTPPGQDAAVSYGETDYRFKNNFNFPIKLEASLSYQAMHLKILGTDEKDYYVELESTFGHDKNLTYANCYQKKFDKETGELISREKVSHSAYLYRG